MRLIATAAFALTAFAQNPAQNPQAAPPPPMTAAVSGVVIDGVTKLPVENATVVLTSNSSGVVARSQQFTDAKGRFVFVNLFPNDKYALAASAAGFVDGSYAQQPDPASTIATNIVVNAGEWVRNLNVSLWRPPTIAGRVIDEDGQPVVGVFVRALKRVRFGGRDVFAAATLTTTDDLGAYRLSGLTPGKYAVQVPSVQTPSLSDGAPGNGRYPWSPSPAPDGRPRGYAVSYYPGTRSLSDAAMIEVGAGENKTGVVIALEPVALYRVSGIVEGNASRGALRLVAPGAELIGNGGETATAPINADGTFEFSGVPAGTYSIESTRAVMALSLRRPVSLTFGLALRLPNPPGQTSSTGYSIPTPAAPLDVALGLTRFGLSDGNTQFLPRQSLSIGAADLKNVVLTMQPGASISGRIEFDVSADKPDARPPAFQLAMGFESAGSSDLMAYVITPSGAEFRLDGIRPGEYFLRSRLQIPWVVKSITVNGADYTARPMEIGAAGASGIVVTVTNRAATISGVVKEKNASVIVFPQDRARWTGYGLDPPAIKVGDTSTSGDFRIEGLPAGDYFVIAVNPTHRMDWLEASFFANAAPLASRVSAAAGDAKTVALSVMEVRK